MMKNRPAIRAENLSHAYGDTPVLKQVSFEVGEGAFYIITGPNGSGKTTLMNILAGVVKAEKGELRIKGKSAAGYSPKELARQIAFVPQLVPVNFPFTVMEIVLFGRAPHQGVLGLSSGKDMEIAKEALEFTRVDHLAHRKINRLSGGERQRVFIARALCQQADIILLDEPTSALDLAHQVSMMDLIETLKKESGITVVMVSHDLNLTAMYADSVLLLKEGKVAGIGTPQEVLERTRLERVYGCRLYVDENPFGNFPRISPVPEKYAPHRHADKLVIKSLPA